MLRRRCVPLQMHNVQRSAMMHEAEADPSTVATAFNPMRWPFPGERSGRPTMPRNASALALEHGSDGVPIADIVVKLCGKRMPGPLPASSERLTDSKVHGPISRLILSYQQNRLMVYSNSTSHVIDTSFTVSPLTPKIELEIGNGASRTYNRSSAT